MSVNTAANRFIVSPFQALRVGLYQHILSPTVSFQELGNRFIRQAEYAQAIRQVEQVREAAQLLINLPLKEYQAAGQYYLAWCDYRNNIDSREALEKIAEHAPMFYRARALQSLAAIEARKQDHESEFRWLIESMKLYPSAEALRGIAIVKVKEGFNRQALTDLESMLPLAQISEPIVFNSWLNSLATELGEAGRKDEARNISRIVVSSPFIHAYPEWQETANDLREPNRSIVALSPSKFIPQNVLDMPATEHCETEQELNVSDSIQAPLSLDESDDNVLEFPHLVDIEKLERESDERFNAEIERFSALINNCHLHDLVDSILIGDMTPARFAKFLLRMSKFEDIKMVQDVFHWMLRYTFNNSDEYKESETEWTERLLKEIESTDTL